MVSVKQHKAHTPQKRKWVLTCRVYIYYQTDQIPLLNQWWRSIHRQSNDPNLETCGDYKKINHYMISDEMFSVAASLVIKSIPLLIVLVIENIPLPIVWWLNFFQLPHDWWWLLEAWWLKIYDHQAYDNQRFELLHK
jgi:hypothetical protein